MDCLTLKKDVEAVLYFYYYLYLKYYDSYFKIVLMINVECCYHSKMTNFDYK